MLAADVRPGLAAILANGIDQCAPRLDPDGMGAAVDIQRDVELGDHARPSLARRRATRIFRGAAGISSISTWNGASASLIAFRTAAGAPMAPPSPTPLALVIEASLVVSM